MKKFLIMTAACVALAACGESGFAPPDTRDQQAQAAANASNHIDFSAGNAEIANIQHRAQLVAQPDLTGYVVLIAMGRPVAYYTVRGKITSSGKRLEPTLRTEEHYDEYPVVDAPGYDGTFGHSDEYIYFWTTTGQYVQWSTGGGNGYMYSDQPLQPNGPAAAALLSTPAAAPAAAQ